MHRFAALALLGAFACDDAPAVHDGSPPPSTLSLSMPPLQANLPLSISVGGASPGNRVFLLQSPTANGGPCLPSLQGCVALTAPFIVASAPADGAGFASFAVSIPLQFVGQTTWLQAAALGASPGLSRPTERVILPPITCGVQIQILTATDANEISWELIDGFGSVVTEAFPGTYEDNRVYNFTAPATDGPYLFVARDDASDGWGDNAFQIFGNAGEVLAAGTLDGSTDLEEFAWGFDVVCP